MENYTQSEKIIVNCSKRNPDMISSSLQNNRKVSPSNDTIKRRINDMSLNVINKLLLYLKNSNFFALEI